MSVRTCSRRYETVIRSETNSRMFGNLVYATFSLIVNMLELILFNNFTAQQRTDRRVNSLSFPFVSSHYYKTSGLTLIYLHVTYFQRKL